jgi:hypothetical protein
VSDQGDVTIITDGKQSIVFVIAGFYVLVDSNIAQPVIFLAFLTAAIPSVTALTIRNMGFPEAAAFGAWLAAMLPAIVIWAPGFRRESISFLLLAVGILGLSYISQSHFGKGLSLLIGACGALWVTRPPLLISIAAGMVATTVLAWGNLGSVGNDHRHRKAQAAILIAAAAAITYVTMQASYASTILDPELRNAIITSNSGPFNELKVSTIPNSITTNQGGVEVFLIPAANSLLVLGGPPPWEWRNPKWAVAGLDGTITMLLCIFLSWGAWRFPKTRKIGVLTVAMCSPLVIATALTLANYGIVIRVRAHLWVIALTFIAVTFTSIAHRWKVHHE